jgi:hypothetical protein
MSSILRSSNSVGKEGFGKPKPLPNEEGYKPVKETERLERESKEMEARLQMLQLRMMQQREDDAAAPKIGGSRWKSGRTDKGTIRGYAKDVQDKIKRSEQRIETKKTQKASAKTMMSMTTGSMDMAALGSTAAGAGGGNTTRMEQAQASAAAAAAATRSGATVVSTDSGDYGSTTAGNNTRVDDAFLSKDIQAWTVQDVTQWLQTVQLSQYIGQFEENEINGPILLEISLEDLDYMGVKILGHRKVLLKGIEDLRKNKRVTISLKAPLSPSKNTAQALAQAQQAQQQSYGSKAAPVVYENLEEPAGANARKYAPRMPVSGAGSQITEEEEVVAAQTVHWSQVEPFQAQQEKKGLKNDVDALHHSNPADGDIIDEEEERRLFQEAVNEWRGQSGTAAAAKPAKVKIYRNGKEVQRKDSGGSEEQQRAAAKEAHAAGMWMNPFGSIGDGGDDGAMSDLLSEEPGSARGGPGAGAGEAGGGSLLEAANADLDEAAERAAFAAAVAEWRGGGKSSSSNNQNDGGATGTGTGTSAAPVAAPGASGQAIAEQLARQMEEEQKAMEAQMGKKMAELTAKLDAAMAAKASADVGKEAETGGGGSGVSSFSYVHETRPVNHGPAAGLTPRDTPRDEAGGAAADDRPLSPAYSDDDDDDDHGAYFGDSAQAMSGDYGSGSAPNSARQQTQPVISMVETSFGAEEFDKVAAEEAYYVVEEDSDDD